MAQVDFSLLGSNFGFAWPAALMALPLALAVLVYAYLKRGQGPRRPVATLLLLRSLKRASVSRKKFIPPARFFFELLLLTLLLLGGAGLFRENKRHTLAILIDNSLSMAAIDPEDAFGASLLEGAKRNAASFLENAGHTVQTKIYITSPVLRALSEDFEPKQLARERLQGITFAFAPDNLETALGRLSLDPAIDQIALFTDRPPAGSTAFSETASPLRDKLVFNLAGNPGRKRQNIALGNLELIVDPLSQTSSTLKATIEAFTSEAVPIRATLYGYSADGARETALQHQNPTSLSHGSHTFSFQNLPDDSQAFKVKIEPAEPGTVNLIDAIKEDNSGWISRTLRSQKVTLISDFGVNDLGLNKIPALTFSTMKPSDYEEKVSSKAQPDNTPAAQIFHRYAPPAWPAANSLFVMPPAENKICQVGTQINQPQITRWESSHPLLKYLNLPTLTLSALTPIKTLPWTAELLSTSAGPAALAGELNGRRYVLLGFEIFPYEGKNAPFLSIFTLNILTWLADFTAGPGYQPPYTPYRVKGAGSKAFYLNPEPASIPPSGEPGGDVYLFPKPGLVKISSPHEAESLLAVNFFNKHESDTIHVEPLELPALTPAQSAVSTQEMLTRFLGLSVLSLILLDLIIQALQLRKVRA